MAAARRTTRILAAAMLAFALAAPASAARVTDPDYPRALDADGPVAVSWGDPADFSELRFSRNRFEAQQGDWVRAIARHLAQRAATALGPGERLEVVILDIDRAGEFEPRASMHDSVRMVRDIYPPSVRLSYTRYDAAGQVVDAGEDRLTDLGFLHRIGSATRSADPLVHEKRLVDDWVRDRLGGRSG